LISTAPSSNPTGRSDSFNTAVDQPVEALDQVAGSLAIDTTALAYGDGKGGELLCRKPRPSSRTAFGAHLET
jgi:hypothetical protein